MHYESTYIAVLACASVVAAIAHKLAVNAQHARVDEELKVGSNSGGGGGGINATDLRGSHKDVIARRHKEGL